MSGPQTVAAMVPAGLAERLHLAKVKPDKPGILAQIQQWVQKLQSLP